MTPQDFIDAINAAEDYETAHAIVLRFDPYFNNMLTSEKNKCRRYWKARKAELLRPA